MKFLKLTTTILFILFVIGLNYAQTTLRMQDFESGGWVLSHTFDDGSNDYCKVSTTFSGLSGYDLENGTNNFIGAEDTNAEPASPGNGIITLDFDNVTITNYNNLTIQFDIAANTSNRYDERTLNNGDYVDLQYNIDNAGWITIGSFCSPTGSNGRLYNDADLNGIGGDTGETIINKTAQTFIFNIPVTGNDLQYRVIFRMESGNEEIAMDNFVIKGIPASTDTTVSFVSTTSAVAENGNTIDVCVGITNESVLNDTTVQINLDPTSTATNGGDYNNILFPATLTFPAGSTANQCITITIIDDVDIESDETIILNLQNAAGGTNASLGMPMQHTLTILDNDAITINPGDIIITEIMQNPNAVFDSNGEWFEVYNTTANPIDMSGWIIKDDSSASETHTIANPVIVPSNGFIVFGINSDFATNGNLTVDYQYDSVGLANGSDGLIIEKDGVIIDQVNWDNGATFPDPTGKSMNLRTTKFDATLNDAGDSWCDAISPYGNGDLGTPGAANDLCACMDQPTVTYINGAWDNGTGPTITDNAVIDDNYTIGINNFESCSCTINNGRILTISAGSYFKAKHEITNNGTIIVENTASIIQEIDDAIVTGADFQINKTTPAYIEYDYTYWSSPTTNAQLGTVFSASPQNRIYEFITTNFDDSSPVDSFDDNNDDWSIASGIMTPGKGYIVMGEGASFPYDSENISTGLTQSVTFTGKINNGIINIPVFSDANLTDAYDNQNLIGNPYPSAIDIKELYNVNKNTLVGGNPILTGTFYFWTHGTQIETAPNTGNDTYNFTNNDYATATTDGVIFNSVASTGTISKNAPEFIASGQSFFADVTDNGTPSINVGNIRFENSMRVTGNNSEFLRITSTIYNRVWINMTNTNGVFRQILIGFFNNATDNHDNGIDGKRLENGDNFDFYSLAGNTQYAIQGLPLLNTNKTVPFGIKVKETGDLTISIDRLEGDLQNVNIYVKDNLFNTLHDLKLADFTVTASQTGMINNRYEFIFSRNTLETNGYESVNQDKLIITNSNNSVLVKMLDGSIIKNIKAFNTLGKRIVSTNSNSNNIYLKSKINTGEILIFKITLENGQVLNKKFIKL